MEVGQKVLDRTTPSGELFCIQRDLLLLPEPLQPRWLWRKRMLTPTLELIPFLPHKLRKVSTCAMLPSSVPSPFDLNRTLNGAMKHSWTMEI